MWSTVYIIGSVLLFFLELLPSSKLHESPNWQITGYDKSFKGIKVLDKIFLICGKINLGVCALLFLLKCMGVIPWL